MQLRKSRHGGYDGRKDHMMAKNGFEEFYNEFLAECDEIAAQCEEEGHPAHGSNYDLRVDQLMKSYPELFEDDDDDDWEDFEDEEWED